MKHRDSSSVRRAAARKKLTATIAVAQRKADAAKKTAKLAKVRLKRAKRTFKQAKRAAKKLRKVVKGLRAEFSSLATRPRRRQAATRNPPASAAGPVVMPPVGSTSVADVVVPSPITTGATPADPQSQNQ